MKTSASVKNFAPTKITSFSVQGPAVSQATLSANGLMGGIIQVPHPITLTGINFYIAGNATGNIMVGLFNSAGQLIASSGSVALSGTYRVQNVPFTTPYVAVPGIYYIAAMPSSAAATFELICSFCASFGYGQGSFTMPSSITPPAINATGVYMMALGTY